MNDEIKEILENVQKCCEIMEDQNFVVYQKQDILKVLDYITNLQQENERLNNIINELEKYIGAEWYCFDNESVEFEVAKVILNKLQELKGSDK